MPDDSHWKDMPGYSESGVDVSSLEEQLKLSYADRLRWLDQAVANLNELQRAAEVGAYHPRAADE